MFNSDFQFIFSFLFSTLPAVCPAAFQVIACVPVAPPGLSVWRSVCPIIRFISLAQRVPVAPLRFISLAQRVPPPVCQW